MKVGVGVKVGRTRVAVGVGVTVPVGVIVGVAVRVRVGCGVRDGVFVGVWVAVAVSVGVPVAVAVPVPVAVGATLAVGDGDGVEVAAAGAALAVGVGVLVAVAPNERTPCNEKNRINRTITPPAAPAHIRRRGMRRRFVSTTVATGPPRSLAPLPRDLPDGFSTGAPIMASAISGTVLKRWLGCNESDLTMASPMCSATSLA